MRILHVVSSTNPQGGGPIEGVKQLYIPLQAIGTIVEIVCCVDPDAFWHSVAGKPVIHALGPSKLVYSYTLKPLPWLRENASRFDAVIVNGLWQYHGLTVRQALAGTKVPYFVFTHGMLDPWFKRAYLLKHLKKWLYWPWGEYRVLRDARAVIFTCEEERLLHGSFFGCTASRKRLPPTERPFHPGMERKWSRAFWLTTRVYRANALFYSSAAFRRKRAVTCWSAPSPKWLRKTPACNL